MPIPPRSKTMKIINGSVINRKLIANSGPACKTDISGNMAVTKIMITIIILKAIIRYFNFNLVTSNGMIKERLFYVNLANDAGRF